MIEILAAISISATPQPGPQIGEFRRAQVVSCRDRQAGSLILVGKLGRADTDREAAVAEARDTQRKCNAAAIAMLGDPWTAPCGQLMRQIAVHASVLEEVYLDLRPENELPSLIHSDSMNNSYRCHQIVEREQP